MSVTTAPARTAAPPAYRLTSRGVLASEWTKFWSLRSTWITLAVSVFLLILIGVIASASYTPTGDGPGGNASDGVGLALSGSPFAAMAVGILGVLLAAGEYSTGMIRSTFAAVPTRLPVLWSKALIAGGIAAVTMTVGALLSFLIGSPLAPESIAGTGLGDDGVLRVLLNAGLYLGLVAVIGVALGVIVRSSAGGIAILVGALLVVPPLTSFLPASWSDAITPILPSTAGDGMMALHTPDGAHGPWGSFLLMTAWVVAALAGAAWRLRKTDA